MKAAMLKGVALAGAVVVIVIFSIRGKVIVDGRDNSEQVSSGLLQSGSASGFSVGDDVGSLRRAKEIIRKQRAEGGVDKDLVFKILQEMKDGSASQNTIEEFVEFLIGLAILENGEVDRIYSFEEYLRFLEFLDSGGKKNGLVDYLFEKYSTEDDIDGLKRMIGTTTNDRRIVSLSLCVIERFFFDPNAETVSKAFEFISEIGIADSSGDSIVSSYAQNLQGWLRSSSSSTEEVPLELVKENLGKYEYWGPISSIYGGRGLERGDLAAFDVAFSGNPYGMERFVAAAVSESKMISSDTASELRRRISLDSVEGVFAARKVLGKLKISVPDEVYDAFVAREFTKEQLAEIGPKL